MPEADEWTSDKGVDGGSAGTLRRGPVLESQEVSTCEKSKVLLQVSIIEEQ